MFQRLIAKVKYRIRILGYLSGIGIVIGMIWYEPTILVLGYLMALFVVAILREREY